MPKGKPKNGVNGSWFGKGCIPWNKGLTKENDKRVDYQRPTAYVKGRVVSSVERRAVSLGMLGVKNHQWKDGRSFEPYPIGWNRTFKEQIRYRDGYVCQECGVPEAECRSKLCIHHLDENKQNLNEKNLISLCRSCHGKLHQQKQEERLWHLKEQETQG